ncbi:phage terminase large subunit family protein [Shewanella baltica]|uniref:phage terminase large subunit family protein n=1 Tax=Shewanella baltica TaxID=62322 RepID=UPI002168A006|nr:terminase gpA endonuclease subunit [Shewanella baltica]MCS6114470.1 phage terminase large subunit family protein [Shewanella baltica]UVW65376.1 phage terminase large subunit family protein [Shewanella baltica]
MSISAAQIKNLKAAVAAGLRSFFRPPMLTCSQYADEHFYMSSESSYTEGKWESLPFQIGILNAMGNDQIRTLNLMKSARVGYTKMLMADAAYKIEHKKRNVLIYQPTDGNAKKFMKKHVETAIRDIPVWRALAPWMGKKNKDNTLEDKIFTNGKTLMVRGGTAAANYREISTDDVIYDELSGFDESIEREGNATMLGDTRIELSMFPKSIRGSTPKVLGTCQIEKACSESPHYFRFNLPCPHCDELQDLKWGGPEEPFGIKWRKNEKGEHDPSTAYYLCEHCGCCIENNQLDDMELHPSAVWICENTGIRTKDFLDFYDADGNDITTPPNISIHIWSAYNSLNSWAKLVTEFFKAKGDKEKLQTFVNTKLGQPWDNDNGERLEWEDLAKRREMYPSGKVPNWVVYLTAGIDTQDDRYEGRIWGWGAGKEAALIDRFILYGDPASQVLKDKVAERIAQSYARADGVVLNIGVAGWDSGGHYTDDVYAMSKKLGLMRVIPLKGANIYGKPIANFPRKRTAKGVYLTEVGTDNAKELLMSMLRIAPDVDVRKPGAIHFPLNEAVCDDVELQQLTSERKVPVRQNGRIIYKWDNQKRRNEALDCFVYALAALYIAIEKFGINLDKLSQVTPITISSDQPKEPKPKAAKQANANAAYLNGGGGGSSGGWL